MSKVIKNKTSSLYENQIENISILKKGDVDKILYNEYIETYYSQTNSAIVVDNLNDWHIDFIRPHIITSNDEFNFFLNNINVPLTKKYHYSLKNIENINTVTELYSATLSLNLYSLIYNSTLDNLYYSNTYSKDVAYINSLTLDSTIDVNFYFDKVLFDSTTDFTNYITMDFTSAIIEKFNCILFDDYLPHLAKLDNGEMDMLIDSTTLNTPLTIKINNKLNREDDIICMPHKVTNYDSTGLVNSIELNGMHLLFKNYFYNFNIDNNELNFSIFNRLIPYLSDSITSYDVYNKNLLMFNFQDYYNSIKTNINDVSELSIYCNNLFNLNIDIVTTSVNENLQIANVYTYKFGEQNIFKAFPFKTIDQKLDVAGTMWSPTNIEFDIFDDHVKYETQDSLEYNYNEFNNTRLSNFILDFDENDDSKNYIIEMNYNDEYNSNNEVIYRNVTVPFLNNSKDCILVNGGFIHDKFSNNHVMLLNSTTDSDYQRNLGISNEIATGLTNEYNEFTLIFYTGITAFESGFNVRLGDFWSVVDGEVYVMNNKVTNYYTDLTSVDSTTGSLMHILTNYDGTINYEIHKSNEIYADLTAIVDTTNNIDISKIYLLSNKKELNKIAGADVNDKYFKLGQLAIYNRLLDEFLLTKIINKFYSKGIHLLPSV